MNQIKDDTKFYECDRTKKECNHSSQCGKLCNITQDKKFAVDLESFRTYKEIIKELEEQHMEYTKEYKLVVINQDTTMSDLIDYHDLIAGTNEIHVFNNYVVFDSPLFKVMTRLPITGKTPEKTNWSVSINNDELTISPSIKIDRGNAGCDHFFIRGNKVLRCNDSFIKKSRRTN